MNETKQKELKEQAQKELEEIRQRKAQLIDELVEQGYCREYLEQLCLNLKVSFKKALTDGGFGL